MKRANGIVLIVSVLMLSGVFMLIIDFQEQRLRNLHRNTYVAEIYSWLPAMPQLLAADNLASMKLMEIVNHYGRLDASKTAKLASAITKEFTASTTFFLADASMQHIETKGVSEADRETWRDFFLLYHQMNMQGRLAFSDQIKELLSRTLGSSFNPIYIANYLSLYSGNYAGEEGVIMIGCRMKDAVPKQVLNRFTSIRFASEFAEGICGYYLVFVPASVYRQPDWYCKNHSLLLPEAENRIFTASQKYLPELLRTHGHAEAAGRFASEARARPNGVFIVADQVYSFCSNQLSGKTVDDDSYFSIIVTDLPELAFAGGNSILKTIILVTLLLLVLVCVNDLEMQRFFSLSITWHFVWLAAAACLLPILALLFQVFSQIQVQGLQNRSEVFNQLAAKIDKIENAYQTKLGDMLQCVNLFHERCVAGNRPISDLCDEFRAELRSHSVREVYVCDRSGHIDFYRVNEPLAENVVRAKEGARLMRLLVQFIQHNVKFSSANAKMSVGDGLIIESVSDLVGKESLYQYALKHNQLLAYRALYGAIWLINFFEYDKNHEPVRFFVYVISRAPFQERVVDKIQLSSQQMPEFLMANQNSAFREKLTPVWLENRPGFARYLRHLNSAGGGFRIETQADGRRYLATGRSFDDIDWSVMAMSEQTSESELISHTSFLLLAAIIFLVIIIAMISRYFSQIFLVPVRQMSESVAAIAEGNYDLRLEVHSADEIGQLSHNFNNMAAGLKEKEYLERFLSDIAREAIGGRISPRATRVEGAVLFSDIRNFTTMTEQKEPEAIVQMLNEFMTAAESSVVKHGGTIEKFIGDAIMVVFLPALGEASPTMRAVLAAEDLLAAISDLNHQRRHRSLFTITVGAGVATGSLLMGTIGNQQGRRDYSVTGKTVLRAAAMEKLTRQVSGKKIVICQQSAEMVSDSDIRTRKLKTSNNETGYELL